MIIKNLWKYLVTYLNNLITFHLEIFCLLIVCFFPNLYGSYPTPSSVGDFQRRVIGKGTTSVIENSRTLNAGDKIAHYANAQTHTHTQKDKNKLLFFWWAQQNVLNGSDWELFILFYIVWYLKKYPRWVIDIVFCKVFVINLQTNTNVCGGHCHTCVLPSTCCKLQLPWPSVLYLVTCPAVKYLSLLKVTWLLMPLTCMQSFPLNNPDYQCCFANSCSNIVCVIMQSLCVCLDWCLTIVWLIFADLF